MFLAHLSGVVRRRAIPAAARFAGLRHNSSVLALTLEDEIEHEETDVMPQLPDVAEVHPGYTTTLDSRYLPAGGY